MSTTDLNISASGMNKATFKKIKKRWVPNHTVEINQKIIEGKLSQLIFVIKDCYNKHLSRRMIVNWRSSNNEWEIMSESQIKPTSSTIIRTTDPQTIPDTLEEIYQDMLDYENSMGSEHGL